jgi:hypothetical protein
MRRRLFILLLILLLLLIVLLGIELIRRIQTVEDGRFQSETQAVTITVAAALTEQNATALSGAVTAAVAERNFNQQVADVTVTAAEAGRATAVAAGNFAATSAANAESGRVTAVAQVSTALAVAVQSDAGRVTAEAQAATAQAERQQLEVQLQAAQAEARNYFATADAANRLLQLFEQDIQLDITPIEATVPPAVVLGAVSTARRLDERGCPADPTQIFNQTDRQIYAVTTGTTLPRGTTLAVRWSLNGQLLEQSELFTAIADYIEICGSFSLETETAFTPGVYSAEFVVNGLPVSSTSFLVEG